MADPTPDAYALHALLEGCTAEVLLNDVPLVASRLRRVQATVHATPWVVDGLNEVRIRVDACRRLVDLPVGLVALDDEAGPVFADARVLAGFYADIVPDDDRDETKVDVSWGPIHPDALLLPREVTGVFRATGRPRWAWQDATVLDPEAPEVRSRVIEVVHQLHVALAARDAGPFVVRMKTLDAEAAHFSSVPGGLAAAFAGELLRQTADLDFALDPWRPDALVLRPVAGGRVLRIEDRMGRPALLGAPSMEMGFAFPLYLAEIGGVLEIARLG